MVKINLAPEIPESPIWLQLEKICWVIMFSIPFLFLLWARFLR